MTVGDLLAAAECVSSALEPRRRRRFIRTAAITVIVSSAQPPITTMMMMAVVLNEAEPVLGAPVGVMVVLVALNDVCNANVRHERVSLVHKR